MSETLKSGACLRFCDRRRYEYWLPSRGRPRSADSVQVAPQELFKSCALAKRNPKKKPKRNPKRNPKQTLEQNPERKPLNEIAEEGEGNDQWKSFEARWPAMAIAENLRRAQSERETGGCGRVRSKSSVMFLRSNKGV